MRILHLRANWNDILAWNIHQAAALWAAFCGGFTTAQRLFEGSDDTVPLRMAGRWAVYDGDEGPVDADGDDLPAKSSHLKLV